jgi:hypothetical protein
VRLISSLLAACSPPSPVSASLAVTTLVALALTVSGETGHRQDRASKTLHARH